MNYLLPVQVGAPDYKNYLNKKLTYFYSIAKIYTKVEPIFNLSNVNRKNAQPTDPNFKTNVIGPYLASLFEGDGHVSLSKIINSKGQISYPYLAITFVNKDLPLITKLLELYGGRL